MADDGMLVNFAVNEAPVKTQQRFKGGSWKDRLVAKKVAQHRNGHRSVLPLSGSNQTRVQPRKPREKPVQDQDYYAPTRPQKRRRQDGQFRPSSEFIPSSKTQDARVDGSAASQSRGNREVISSLFSYNPQPTTVAAEEDKMESEPAKPSNAPLVDGIDTFTSLGLSQTLAAHLLTKMELKDPTAIQKAAVSEMLKDDGDAFIQSETGSGKTLAYLLPLVQRIMNLSSQTTDAMKSSGNDIHRDSGLFAIILAPTRELCKQISVVLERVLGCAHWIVAGTVIGGEKKKSEKARLRKGINILVATPGRLADHLDNTKVLDISTVRWLVLDEGDRLMDLGFEDEIQKIVKKLDERQQSSPRVRNLPSRRTTILCSATMKMNVQRLGEISLKDANLIKGETSDQESAEKKEQSFLAPAQLKQSYAIVAAKLRLVTLIGLLKRTFARKGSVMKAIVFVSCADSVEFLFEMLSHKDKTETKEAAESGSDTDSSSDKAKAREPEQSNASSSISEAPLISSSSNPLTLYKLHGSLPQATRTSIVNTFSRSTSPSLLISTDVASRGLDLPNLDLVIEYDPAFSSDDHLHRIGRTARLGRDGRAIIFLLPGEEEGYVDVLRKSYRDAEGARALTHMSAEEILKRGFTLNNPTTTTTTKYKNEKPNKSWEETATTLQLNLERLILSSPTHLLPLSRKAYQSHIRAYATHTSDERKYFNIKSLHLGHLAKSFALRDKPSGIGIPGRNANNNNNSSSSTHTQTRKPTSTNTKAGLVSAQQQQQQQPSSTSSTTTAAAGEMLERPEATTTAAAETEEQALLRRKKMRQKMKEAMMMMKTGGGAGEFNIA